MKKGISLIVLVITIIVMIILAGAIILTLSNNGIIDKASQAVDMTNINNVQETASLLWSDAYIAGSRSETELAIQVVNGLAKIEGVNINDYIVDVTTSGVTVEKAKYAYYDTLKAAVDAVNNGTVGTNSVDKTNAIAGVHTSNGKTYVVLLKDVVEETTVQASKDMTINLNGKTLSSDSDNKATIEVTAGNVTIDGTLENSTIKNIRQDGQDRAMCLSIEEGANATIKGGEYISSNTTKLSAGIRNRGTASIYKCNIFSTATSQKAYGVLNGGTVSVSSCDIKAYANCIINGSAYGAGVYNKIDPVGTVTINDCKIMGTQVGVANHEGKLYIDGGKYEGSICGGLYLSDESYVKNAEVTDCDMPEGYSVDAPFSRTGMYIGEANNIIVYMDNCKISGKDKSITYNNNDADKNNKLYISNSTINKDYTEIGIDLFNNTNKLFIGNNCNFTAEDTNFPDDETMVKTTEETYVR